MSDRRVIGREGVADPWNSHPMNENPSFTADGSENWSNTVYNNQANWGNRWGQPTSYQPSPISSQNSFLGGGGDGSLPMRPDIPGIVYF